MAKDVEPIEIPPNKKHAQVVYFVTGEGLGVVKIGTTNNMANRFARMKRTSPGVKPLLIAWYYGTAADESREHASLRQYLLSRDWFVLSGAVENRVRNIRKGMETGSMRWPVGDD